LGEGFSLFENSKNIFVKEVMGAARISKGSMFYAVVLESLNIILSNAKCFNAFVVFQF